MSSIGNAVDKHRLRIVAEVETVLWNDNPGLRSIGRSEVRGLVDQLVTALVSRVELADDPVLNHLLRHAISTELLSPATLIGTLIRIAGAVRSVLNLEVSNRRAVAIASTALDRAVAEVIEELRGDLVMIGATDPGVAPPERREATIVRNIREILGGGLGDAEEVTASLVFVVLREDGLSTDAGGLRRRDAVHARCVRLIDEGGARVVMETPMVVGACITARVDDTDVHEAVALALAIQRADELSQCGFGIVRGRVLLVPSDSGDSHTVSGEIVTRGLALATTAKPGVVLTDESVHALAGDIFALRPVSATESAFRLDPDQPQWLDRWEQASLIGEPEFVGRTEVLQKLRTHLRSPTRKVTLVGLRGPTAVGKDRLLAAGLDGLGIPAERIFRAEPHPLTPAPYWAVITVVRKLLGLDDGPVREARLRQSLERLDEASATTTSLRSLLPTVSALLGVDEADESMIDSSDTIEPVALRSEIAKTLRLLLEAAADQQPDRPLVLALRDVQNADLPTMHALAHVVRNYQGTAQLIVALCYHGTFRPPATFVDAGLLELPVPPLNRQEVVQIAASMLDQDDVPPDIAAVLRNRSAKLPMTAIVIVRYLVELGALQRRAGVWAPASPVRPADIPRRLTDLLARRIALLPAQLSSLLKSAATVGEPLAWNTLELIWVSRGLAHDELQRSIGLLQEMGFLAQGDDRSTLRFAHPIVRQVAYRMQSEDERRETHRLTVVAYRERYPDAIRQIPSVIFRHCMESGDACGARDAAVQAVRRALLLHDHKRGLAVVAEALGSSIDDSVDGTRAHFDLLAVRERIYDARGNRAEQRADVRVMVSLAEKAGDERRLGVALHRAARLNLLTGDLPRARAVAGKALARLRHGDPLDLSNALRTLALIRWQERDPAEAAAALNEALQIYERLGHRRGMGFVLHNLGLFALDTGAVDQARHYFERSLALKEETEDPQGRAVVLDGLGQVALLGAEPDVAAERFEAALGIRAAAGDTSGIAQTEVHLGLARLSRDPASAEALARSALEQSHNRRQARTKVEANILLARALLAQGSKEAASRASSQALRGADDLGAQIIKIRARLVRAEVDLAYRSKKRLERAAALADEAAHTSLQAGAVRWRIEALSVLAEARQRLENDDAIEAAQEALALLSERQAVGLDVALIQRRCYAVLGDDEATAT